MTASRFCCSLIGLALAIDGDTLQILPADVGCRVRIWGVNAYELHEDNGAEAREALATLLTSFEPVSCVDTRGTSYSRVVARCVLSDGRDLGEALVRGGHAVDAPTYSQGHYAVAEAEARRHGRGMWGGD